MIDAVNSRLMYGDDIKECEKDPKLSVLFRDIKGVAKNVVSMPDSKDKLVKKSTTDPNIPEDEIDRGPSGHQFALEIYLSDRLFTLYTDDENLQEQYAHAIDQILIFKTQIQSSQKQHDDQIKKKTEAMQ